MSDVLNPLRFVAAVSDEDEPGEAMDETLGPVTEALGDAPADLAILFVSPHHTGHFPRMVERLHRQLRPRVVLGLTACGVIGGQVELERRAGVSVLAARLPGVELHTFTYDDLGGLAETEPDALRLAMTGDRIEKPAGVLFFGDPFSTPMLSLLPAMNATMPGVPVIGGMASAGAKPGDNRLLLNDRILREGAIGLAIGGAIRVDCTVSQGCRPIGKPWVITKARQNLIQEIGGRPSLEVIREMAEAMPAEDQSLLERGLFVGRVIDEYKEGLGRGDFLIRNILGADPASGYIAIGDLVRAGQTIQFHVRDAASAEEDLSLLLERQSSQDPAAGVLLCSCNGRGSNMFDQPNTESRLIERALGQPPLAGFFAAGEIGPIGDQNFLHGFTASLAVFRPI